MHNKNMYINMYIYIYVYIYIYTYISFIYHIEETIDHRAATPPRSRLVKGLRPSGRKYRAASQALGLASTGTTCQIWKERGNNMFCMYVCMHACMYVWFLQRKMQMGRRYDHINIYNQQMII